MVLVLSNLGGWGGGERVLKKKKKASNFLSGKALERKAGEKNPNWCVGSKSIDLVSLGVGKHSIHRSWSSMDRIVVSLSSLVV